MCNSLLNRVEPVLFKGRPFIKHIAICKMLSFSCFLNNYNTITRLSTVTTTTTTTTTTYDNKYTRNN